MGVSGAKLESLNEYGDGIQVEFEWSEDRYRYAHTISFVKSGAPIPLLSSIEGTHRDFSPPSPPFTELHLQDEHVFSTGATPIGHWSVSVGAGPQRLDFEVACRLKRKSAGLGSLYQIFCEDFQIEPHSCTIVESDGKEIHFVPAVAEKSQHPATIQWRYSIAMQ